jgi:hypothetical protein
MGGPMVCHELDLGNPLLWIDAVCNYPDQSGMKHLCFLRISMLHLAFWVGEILRMRLLRTDVEFKSPALYVVRHAAATGVIGRKPLLRNY